MRMRINVKKGKRLTKMLDLKNGTEHTHVFSSHGIQDLCDTADHFIKLHGIRKKSAVGTSITAYAAEREHANERTYAIESVDDGYGHIFENAYVEITRCPYGWYMTDYEIQTCYSSRVYKKTLTLTKAAQRDLLKNS